MENLVRGATVCEIRARTCPRSRRDPCDLAENEISKIRYLNKPERAEGPEGTPEGGAAAVEEEEREKRQDEATGGDRRKRAE